jgi:alpha-beta hydrolase superfamily lysophospholipase
VNPTAGQVPAIQIDVRIDKHTALPGRVWCAERPRALVAIVHGLGEHGARYAATADALVDRRFSVVALDLPGHGEAPGPRGDFASWIDVRDRIVPLMFTVTRGLPGQPLDLPVVLLGHSMGGLMALDYALAHPKTLLGVVASAPALRSDPPPPLKVALGKVARLVQPSAGFPNGIKDEDISRDPEVVAARRNDPLVHDRISPRTYFAFLEARERVMRESHRLQVPTLLLQGAADKVVDPKGTLEFTVSAPHELVRLITYRDAYHEIFNDLCRDQVMKDLVGWLDAIVVV